MNRQSFCAYTGEELSSFSFRAELFSVHSTSKKDVSVSREEYSELIQKTKENLRSKDIEKIVISRIKRVPRPDSLSLSALLLRLELVYPKVFVYAFKNSSGELWMGATPELLLRKRKNLFTTVALAGTQPFSDSIDLENYRWGTKEIREQKIVTEFIVQVLRTTGAQNVHAGETLTVKAGKVVHLKSTIQFESDLDADHWLHILHPTPAVCGFPKNESLQFILDNEPHDRAYYTGFLGVQQANGDADFYVNLRCMRVREKYFDLFVGGGILADSDPDAEWDETEWKAGTLLSVIQ